jgi:protein-L-isoaspartate(D-aspartate) O-methyltransferase
MKTRVWTGNAPAGSPRCAITRHGQRRTLPRVHPLRAVAFGFAIAALGLTGASSQGEAIDSYDQARRKLLEEIAADVRDTAEFLNRRELDERVMRALASVPRHEFVPAAERESAYENRPLPIGHGQTISQPYIVAIMTDLVEPRPGCRAFELGTGSGYQAAILSELCKNVYTVEIVEPLGVEARKRLERLGRSNVEVRVGDGYYGWAEHAPFDVIVVTAVASHIPPPLIKQLKPGGRMILPVVTRFTTQQLVLVLKGADGHITTRQVLPVAFVPLTGGHE